MKHILVATDGSASAEKAVRAAAELAAAGGAKLTLINVQDGAPLPDIGHFAEVEFGDRLAQAGVALSLQSLYTGLAARDAAQVFNAQAAVLHQTVSDAILLKAREQARDAGVKEPEAISAEGDAAQEIVAAAKRIGADLIVVGRRGLGGLSGLLGGVSRKVLHQAPMNVLTVTG